MVQNTWVWWYRKIKLAQKIYASSGRRDYAHASSLVGVAFLVLKILLFLFFFKFLFWTMDYSPWGPKNRLAQKIRASRGWREMHGNQFWWVRPLWFLRFCPFFVCLKTAKISFLGHGLYNPWESKNRIISKIYTNRGWHGMHGSQFWWANLSDFWDFAPFCLSQNSQNFPLDHSL